MPKETFCINPLNHSRGVVTLFSDRFAIKVHNHIKSQDGRRLLINFEHEGENKCIVNAYAQNNEQDRIQFFKKLNTWISQKQFK